MKKEIKKSYEQNYYRTIDEVKSRMDAFGITQSTLSEALGMDNTQLNKIINKNTIPSVVKFVAIINTVNQISEQVEKAMQEKLKKNQTKLFDGKTK